MAQEVEHRQQQQRQEEDERVGAAESPAVVLASRVERTAVAVARLRLALYPATSPAPPWMNSDAAWRVLEWHHARQWKLHKQKTKAEGRWRVGFFQLTEQVAEDLAQRAQVARTEQEEPLQKKRLQVVLQRLKQRKVRERVQKEEREQLYQERLQEHQGAATAAAGRPTSALRPSTGAPPIWAWPAPASPIRAAPVRSCS